MMNRTALCYVTSSLLACIAVAGCAPHGSDLPALDAQSSVINEAYTLGPGDKLQITVFGVDDMSGQFTVSEAGMVGVPVIGEVRATGETVAGLQHEIVDALSGKYVKNPRVGIEVLNYRPFYILGEVNRPGSYPYVANMTVSQAVATAGGYTHRAEEDFAVVNRIHDGQRVERRAAPSTSVLPDDTIRVPERYF
jgi:polysaccharide export outer membrane protein